jgi:hypothetical protein
MCNFNLLGFALLYVTSVPTLHCALDECEARGSEPCKYCIGSRQVAGISGAIQLEGTILRIVGGKEVKLKCTQFVSVFIPWRPNRVSLQ